jgi:uncharacterized glyoxalase superfamily protein PhnB
MANHPIPPGYHTVTPYIIAPRIRDLLRFLERAFDATSTMPPMERPDGTIMHAEVQVGNSRIMMGESSEQWPAKPGTIFLYVPDVDESYRRALEAGATSVMEVSDQFYGDRMGGVEDPSGTQWWLASHVEDVPPEEMGRRRDAYLASLTPA